MDSRTPYMPKTGYRSKAEQKGFTLVEIAIVLVIIGLLLGGILKGQEMITQAKIKNIVNDFNGITAAVNSYQDRYRSLPGDDLQAASRWSAAPAADPAVNGNGQIAGLYNNVLTTVPATAAEESNLFWWHLRLAGFVAGATTGIPAGQQPANAANGIMGVQTSGLGFTSNIVCSSNLQDKIAIAVDTQMDDGANATGQVRGSRQDGPNPTVAEVNANSTTAYAETGTNQYLVCKSL